MALTCRYVVKVWLLPVLDKICQRALEVVGTDTDNTGDSPRAARSVSERNVVAPLMQVVDHTQVRNGGPGDSTKRRRRKQATDKGQDTRHTPHNPKGPMASSSHGEGTAEEATVIVQRKLAETHHILQEHPQDQFAPTNYKLSPLHYGAQLRPNTLDT